ncbi:MAG: GAF domain-containing protein [Bacteroidales bacterium]|nr:GAF domain-containing protein [Bacteroidales bacterium]
MFNPGKYRIYSILLLLAFIVAVLLLSGTIWNIYLNPGKPFSILWPAIIIIIIIVAVSATFIIAYNLSDTGVFNAHIENIVKNERIRLLKEFEDKKESQGEAEKKEVVVEETVAAIVPEGKGIKSIEAYAGKLLSNFADAFEMVQGLCYIAAKDEFSVVAKYAFTGEHVPASFKTGETLPGQAALNKETTVIGEVPENYFGVKSGLGESLPRFLVFVPLVYKNKTIALLELASFKKIDDSKMHVFNQLSEILGEKLAKFNK